MPKVAGREEVRRFLARAPEALKTKMARGAARAFGAVIAEEAKARSISKEVADAIKVTAKLSGNQVVAKVLVKGPGAYIAPWLEYGTAPHFISVDPDLRQGMTARRVNIRVGEGDTGLKETLLINGKPVGKTVHHPGTDPVPFLFPAFDIKRGEGIAAAQTYLNTRIARSGLTGPDEKDGEA